MKVPSYVFVLYVLGVFNITGNFGSDISMKVIHGKYTNISNSPWAASISIMNNIWGAGAIMNNNWILTSAFNCFWEDASYVTVRVGSAYWSEGGNIFQVEKCIKHENYTGSWSYDIALLKVKGSMSLGKSTTKKILTPKKSRKENALLTVSGWGVISDDNRKENKLHNTTQTVTSDTECSRLYNLTSSTHFCAHNAEAGPCVFDYGAPAVSHAAKLNNKRVFGLYLGSTNCSEPENYHSIYVDVFQFKTWITNTIANN